VHCNPVFCNGVVLGFFLRFPLVNIENDLKELSVQEG